MLAKNYAPPPTERLTPAIAADRLFGFFPVSAASDARLFMTGVISIFERYPVSVVHAVLSPFNGLPSKHKFLPSLMEIKEECELHYAPMLRAMERERVLQETRLYLEGPKIPKPTLAQLQAKYGPNWGLKTIGDGKPKPLTAGQVREKYGISEETWAQIGDSPLPDGFNHLKRPNHGTA